MKAIIVDDEELALLHFNHMLERTNAFQSILMFQDPADVLEYSGLSAADAVFLDIEMPVLSLLNQFRQLMKIFKLFLSPLIMNSL